MRGEDSPSGGANHALALILFLDGTEFVVDELGDVADERKYFADAVVDQRKGRQEIYNGPSD
jgi:hypothetical protein